MRIFTLIFCFCAVALTMSACVVRKAAQEKEKEIAFEAAMKQPVTGAISIHTFIKFPENKPNEISVPSFFHTPVTVDAEPWLTSMDIVDVIPQERPIIISGVYDLKLILTDAGVNKWEKMVEKDPEAGYAFLVDGTLYTTFHPWRDYKKSDYEIVVDGPFDDVVTLKLHKQAPLNYLKLKKQAAPAIKK